MEPKIAVKLKAEQFAEVDQQFTIDKSAKGLEDGQFKAILSTGDVDRHGEIVSIKGLDIPDGQTIKMYYNHQTYGSALPIGKWLEVKKSAGKLIGLGQIDVNDPFAMQVYSKIMNGFLDSISIGFYPHEFDSETVTWTKSTLVEASVVAEPANVNALITSKGLDFSAKEFHDTLTVKLKEAGIDKLDDRDTLPDITDTKDDALKELATAIKDLSGIVRGIEGANLTEKSTKKEIVQVRLKMKDVSKSAEEINSKLRITLKG